MPNGKVTLAELRKEAARVFGDDVEVNDGFVTADVCQVRKRTVLFEARGSSKMKARRRLQVLLKALPEGMVMP